MKKLIALTLVLLLALAAVACSQPAPAEPAPAEPAAPAEPETPAEPEAPAEPTVGKIAFFVKTPNNPFFVTMAEAAEATAKELGVEIYVDGPQAETEVEKQVAMVENAIAEGVGAIVIAPCDKTPLIPAIAQATKAGIPVINVDDFIDKDELAAAGGEIVSFIGSDNFAGGKLAGEAMGKAFEGQENVKIAVIEGMAGVPNSILRADGFKEALSAFANCEVVFSQPGDWDTQKGYDQATNAITANPDLKGIFCCNDQMAMGALSAAAAAGREDILIIGYDANTDAVEKVLSGELYGTVAQYPSDMGKQGVETAVKVMKGEAVEENVGTLILFIGADNAQDQLDGKLG